MLDQILVQSSPFTFFIMPKSSKQQEISRRKMPSDLDINKQEQKRKITLQQYHHSKPQLPCGFIDAEEKKNNSSQVILCDQKEDKQHPVIGSNKTDDATEFVVPVGHYPCVCEGTGKKIVCIDNFADKNRKAEIREIKCLYCKGLGYLTHSRMQEIQSCEQRWNKLKPVIHPNQKKVNEALGKRLLIDFGYA